MPALSNPTLWRTHPHTTEGYLVVYVPSVVLACSVNQSTFSYPILQITYDTVTSGAYTAVKTGMTVKIYSSAGVFKGYGRVRATPTSAILYVGALPQGDVDFADNDLIEVLDEYRISNKISINADDASIPLTYKDYSEAFSDQTLYPPPQCNLGPDVADFVDGDGYVYASFDLTASCYAVAAGATISSYSADLAGGTVTSGSVASGIFTVRYGAGKRHIVVTITDSNTKTHTAKRLIVGCEKTGANAPLPCRVRSLGYQDHGWDAEFEILASAGPTVIPNQAKVIYFEKENYGGTAGSLNGFAGREQVKFTGWVDVDENEIQPLLSNMRIRCIGSRERLNREAAYGGQVTNDASPASWQEMANLGLFEFIHYLLYWHTTLLDVCDLEKPVWASLRPYWTIGVPQGLMADTVNTLAGHTSALFTCDHQGRFFLRYDWMMLSDSDRGDVVTAVALEAHDWEIVNIEERHINQAYAVSASGVVASRTTVTPLQSVAPGLTPGQGGTNEQLNNQLVTNQTELNMRAGRLYGRKNSVYGNMTIRVWPGGMVADPAWGERVQLTLDETTNKRGVSFASDYFLPQEVRVQHDHEAGTTSEEWTVEPETFGAPGATLPVRIEAIDDLSLIPLAEFPPWEDGEFDPRVPADVEFAVAPALYMVHGDYITRTRNHTDASPSWEIVVSSSDLATAIGSPSATIYGMALDPWNPKWAAYVQAICTTPPGGDANNYGFILFYVANLDDPPGTQVITRLSDPLSISAYTQAETLAMVRASINVNGSVWTWGIGYNDHGFQHARTATGGSVVGTDASPFDFWRDDRIFIALGLHMAGAGSGKVYVGGTSGYGTGRPWVLRSTVMGTDWAGFPSYGPVWWDSASYEGGILDNKIFTALHVPYSDNPDDEVVYVGSNYDGVHCLLRHNADDSWDAIGPLVGSDYYHPTVLHDGLHSYTQDRQYLTLIGAHSTTEGLLVSTDAGDTWAVRNTPEDETAYLGGLWGWPYDPDVMMMSVSQNSIVTPGANRGIWLALNLFAGGPTGVSWANALGDWETVTGDVFTTPLNVVPVWVP